MPTKIDNNALIHDYLIPIIKYVNFSECENPTQMKRLISKLMTIAKKSMKANNDPSDMSVIDPSDMSVMENIELSPAIVIAQSKAGAKKKPTKVVKKIVNPKDSEESDDDDDSDDSTKAVEKKKEAPTKPTTTTKPTKPTKTKKPEKPVAKTVAKSDEDSDDDKKDSDDEIKITSILKKETSNDSDMEDPISDDE